MKVSRLILMFDFRNKTRKMLSKKAETSNFTSKGAEGGRERRRHREKPYSRWISLSVVKAFAHTDPRPPPSQRKNTIIRDSNNVELMAIIYPRGNEYFPFKKKEGEEKNLLTKKAK